MTRVTSSRWAAPTAPRAAHEKGCLPRGAATHQPIHPRIAGVHRVFGEVRKCKLTAPSRSVEASSAPRNKQASHRRKGFAARSARQHMARGACEASGQVTTIRCRNVYASDCQPSEARVQVGRGWIGRSNHTHPDTHPVAGRSWTGCAADGQSSPTAPPEPPRCHKPTTVRNQDNIFTGTILTTTAGPLALAPTVPPAARVRWGA